ncbi:MULTISPECIES: YbaB/EbfC family nucleoid-associated protein [Desertihabitans]|uniref:Nucleoid-associated protein DT076_18200 n=1 Tax=Desertihabitans brevis TaxID=2268447 RepID=A0A367YQD5_9ACTN|nr:MULTISPECIES: YbaB/EbfC family nucleoid-associated protein [Desertihabitans]RCK67990.1 YbaB/EbfC family nucleoid-associated protein [Desertihabitans brevis]
MLPEGTDMSGLLAQAQAMQSQMMQAQEELAATTVEGTAGGGLVTARMTATGELQSLDISPEACDPTDTESLADLVVAAIRDASAKGQELAAAKLGPMAGGLGL